MVVLLLALFWLQAITAVHDKSPTFDEPNHFVAGYTYWAGNDYRLNPEGGNWLQRWAALPLVLGHEPPYGDVLPDLLFQGRMMMAMIGAALGLLIFLWSRQLWGAAGGFVSLWLFVFSPDMLGHSPLVTTDVGTTFFFAAATWSFWRMLHHLNGKSLLICGACVGGLFLAKFSAVIFLPAAVFMVVLRLWFGPPLFIRGIPGCSKSSARQTIPASVPEISSWVSPSDKSQPLLSSRNFRVPAGDSLTLTKPIHKVLALSLAFVVLGFLIWGLIWASFSFRYNAQPNATFNSPAFFHPEFLPAPPGIVSEVISFVNRHRLLPEAYSYGFKFTYAAAQQRNAFLLGNFSSRDGWRWFFPYAFMVKTPLPTLILFLFALLAIGKCRDCRISVTTSSTRLPGTIESGISDPFYSMVPLATLFLVYFGVAVFSHINIGVRHLFPIYPGLFILAGGVSMWLPEKSLSPTEAEERNTIHIQNRITSICLHPPKGRRLLCYAILSLLLWQTVESWQIRPHYLAYFNQLAGGPQNGYRCLVDSSLDWGQDLPGLRDWLSAHRRPGQPVYLSYFGSTHPGYYDIDAILLPGFVDWRKPSPSGLPEPLRPGIYCISATMLQLGFDVCPGPWLPEHESKYQYYLNQLHFRPQNAPNGTSDNERSPLDTNITGNKIASDFEWLRLGRLRAYLRLREPDANVGYSILIYHLTEEELHTALDAQLP